MNEAVLRTIGIDTRTLAALRIILAALILGDLFFRVTDLETFYTNHGVLPQPLWHEFYLWGFQWSLHLLNGSTFYQIFLFFLSALTAILFLIGYRTRLAGFVSWVLLSSLHNRNPLVLNGGDTYLRVVLFWSLFLPLGEAFSIKNKGIAIRKKVANIASFALLVQIAAVYTIGVLLKSGRQWLPDGTAVYFALSRETVTTHLGSLVRQAPLPFLKFFTYTTLLLEILAPILLFVPFHRGRWKLLGIILLLSLQLGFMVNIKMLGFFPWASMGVLVAFLPPEFWDHYLPMIWKNRKAFSSSCSHPRLLSQFPVPIALIVLIFAVINLSDNVSVLLRREQPTWLTQTLQFFQLKQYWGMYAPEPSKSDYRYRLEARISDDSSMNLRLNGTLAHIGDSAKETYKNSRWRNYIPHLHHEGIRNHYFRYLCKKIYAKPGASRSVVSIALSEYEIGNEIGNISREEKPTRTTVFECEEDLG